MLNEQDGALVIADAVYEFAQLHFLGRIHAGRGFVKRNQLGIGGQCAGDLQATLVAVGQRAGLEICIAADAYVIEQFLGARSDRGFFGDETAGAQDGAEQAGLGADVAADHDVLEGRHVGKEADVLEGAGNTGTCDFMDGRGGIGFTGQFEAAAVRGVETGDDVEEGGLARAIGTNEAIDLTAFDGQAHVGESLQAAKTLGDTGNAKDGVCHGACLRSRGSATCHARVQATGRAGAAA